MMGYIRHDAIIITSWKRDAIDKAAEEARRLGLIVIGPSDERMNGYRTFLVCPDGSKEGWNLSDEFDAKRLAFIEYLDEIRYEDGSSCLEWVAVSYGSDDKSASVVCHTWDVGVEV